MSHRAVSRRYVALVSNYPIASRTRIMAASVLPASVLPADPRLLSVSPVSGMDNDPALPMTLIGVDFPFGPGYSARLYKVGLSEIILSSVSRVSATTVTGTANLVGAIHGRWNVELTIGGNVLTLFGAFEVTLGFE